MMSVCFLVEFLTFRRPFPATLLTAFGGSALALPRRWQARECVPQGGL